MTREEGFDAFHNLSESLFIGFVAVFVKG